MLVKNSYIKERYKLILGYFGIVCIILGISLLLPLLLLLEGEFHRADILSFGILGISNILLGLFLKKYIGRYKNITLTFQEGGVLVLALWIFAVVVGALPFVFKGQLSFTQAVFESTSGFTTTGLSMVDVTQTSQMILLWRSIMQFLGGAGLAVIMLSAVIGPLGTALYNAEARSDMLMPNIKNSTKTIMVIYSGYISAGILLYKLAGMTFFDSINHSIAAVSTGGFSTKLESIGHYNSLSIELITIILMILGTVNFGVHLLLIKGKLREVFRIGEIRFMGVLMFIFIPLVTFHATYPLFQSAPKSFRIALFEVTSALSTTGFSTVSYGDWSSFGYFVLLILMFIGGGSGSTAGGIKQYRVYTLIKNMWWNIKKMALSKKSIQENSIYKPEGKVFLDSTHLNEIIIILTGYIFTYVIAVLILLTQGYGIKESMFEIASCLSTVGLSLGVTSTDASALTVWTMTVAMLLGRLEFLVVVSTGLKIIRDFRLSRSKEQRV